MSDSHGSGFVPQRFLLAEFASPEALLDGTTKMREKGYGGLDTHTPYPMHGIEEALGIKRVKIPTIVLCGALTGLSLAYSMMYFMNVVDYPIMIGNRPAHSPLAFIPISFELTVLLGGLSSFVGTMVLCGFPRPYHPVFESDNFKKATIDGMFLSIELPADADVDAIAADVKGFGATVTEVVEESER